MENKKHKTSVFENIASVIEEAVSSLFGPVKTENLPIVQIHFMTSQML